MNTGMQDAFNLAWKLALVVRGICDERLLDSYSPERSKVGDEVLKDAERLTNIGTMRNPVAQTLRNLAAHVMLGFFAVQRQLADTMTEVSIGYPDSPLNGPRLQGGTGPKPGERVIPVVGQVPAGAGGTPRFALFATPTAATTDLIRRFAGLHQLRCPAAMPGRRDLARSTRRLCCLFFQRCGGHCKLPRRHRAFGARCSPTVRRRPTISAAEWDTRRDGVVPLGMERVALDIVSCRLVIVDLDLLRGKRDCRVRMS